MAELTMAELTMTAFLSLDGVMQAPDRPEEGASGNFSYGGWLVPHADENMGQVITSHLQHFCNPLT